MTNTTSEPKNRSVNMKITDTAADALAVMMCTARGKTRDDFIKRAVYLINLHGWKQ